MKRFGPKKAGGLTETKLEDVPRGESWYLPSQPLSEDDVKWLRAVLHQEVRNADKARAYDEARRVERLLSVFNLDTMVQA